MQIKFASAFMKIVIVWFLMIGAGSIFASDSFQIIKEPGVYLIAKNRESLRVTEINQECKILRENGGGIVFSVSPGWLLYSDSSRIVWTYDGRKEIRRCEFKDDGISMRESHDVPELWEEAPQTFLQAISRKK